jgi:hypothetical protein
MPCYYTGSAEGDALLGANEDISKLQKERLKLTQLLCSICKTLDDSNGSFLMSAALRSWWKKHSKQDKKAKKK